MYLLKKLVTFENELRDTNKLRSTITYQRRVATIKKTHVQQQGVSTKKGNVCIQMLNVLLKFYCEWK